MTIHNGRTQMGIEKKMDRKEEKRKERRKKMSGNMRQTENIENHSEKQI